MPAWSRRLAPSLQRLFVTLGALALALGIHVPHFPLWITAAVAIAMAWRLAAEHRGWALPPRWMRFGAALLATAGVLLGYRTLNGLDAGTALLAVMAGLKLSETRAPRDHAVLVFIGYFLCLAALLYEQSFTRFAYVLLASWALTAALARVHRPIEANTPVQPFRLSGRMLGLGVPLAIVLFLFVPRIEGRFWAVPASESVGRGGIDETMSPGDIANLSLSDEPAFRAWFEGAPPPPEQRYWRALVLESFDGRTWTRAMSFARSEPALTLAGRAYEYRIALEPTRRPWLPALDFVERWDETLAVRTARFELVAFDARLGERRPVTSRLNYSLRSYPDATPAVERLSADSRRRNLALPQGRHPRARVLAERLRAGGAADEQVVARALDHFRTGDFAYTLSPPPLPGDPVDTFLFDTREGFCEHYSSAFTVLMRAAGIPTRVVTGYQGGEYNVYGNYLLVRQSTAHAWTEVWLDGRGWTRVDPTAAVAPERVRRGAIDAASVGAEAPGAIYDDVEWLGDLRSAWDAVRTAWADSVVGYGPELQTQLLDWLGLARRGWQGLAIALAIGFAIAALALAGWLGWELRPARRDPVVVAWQRACERLAALGHARAAHEGPLDYARRVAHAAPALATDVQRLADAYVGVRYLPDATAADRERFLAYARDFAPQERAAGS